MPGDLTPKSLFEKIKGLPRRLLIALGCYLVLLVVGLVVLLPARNRQELFLLEMFLAVFAIFTIKTIVHAKKGT